MVSILIRLIPVSYTHLTNNLPDLKVHDYLPRSLQKEAVEWLGRNLFVAPLWLYPDEVVSRTGVKPVDEISDRQSSVVALLLAPGMLYNIYSTSLCSSESSAPVSYTHLEMIW